MSPFEELLRERIGLDAASIGASVIERAVQRRQAACGIADREAYLALLQGSETELQELIESVVVLETWFFRDREAFAALSGVVLHEWLQSRAPVGAADRVLRVLSLPCATGEEPYSMAMALLATGLPAEQFRIDAVDISARALDHARAGVYGPNSFRGGDLGFRKQYFEVNGPLARIADDVRRPVRFRQGNLFDAGFTETYDVIFCRNVLIYFDRDTQDRAVRILTGLLAPAGFLFVGPSETGVLFNHGLTSARLPFAFAYRHATPAPRSAVYPLPRPPKPMPPPPRRRPQLVAVPPRPAPAPPAPGLEQAMELADQGRLAEAARICDEHLRRQGPSAEVFYLLGLIRDAGDDAAGAAEHYRKALYLDPHHLEALAHLALILERQGDAAGARVLRERAQRPARGAKQ